MVYDEGQAQIMRDDLAGLDGIAEKNMFGGIAFMLNGNMLCGVHKSGGMFRVGKENEATALAVDGAREMDFTGRRMGGFIEVTDEAIEDDAARGQLMALAQRYVSGLPAK